MISAELFTIFATAWGIGMLVAGAIKIYILDKRKERNRIKAIWKESYGKE
jgi:hypothetical protein